MHITDPRPLWRANRLLLTSSAALLVGIVIVSIADFRDRYRSAMDSSKQHVQTLADVLAEHTARTFEALDRALRTADGIRISIDESNPNSSRTARDTLRGVANGSPALRSLGWTDAQGDMVMSTAKGGEIPTNIADLPHFQILQRSDRDGMLIGPLYVSKAGDWTSATALRFNDATGHFAGIVVASLDLSYFSRTFRRLQNRRSDSISLLTLNGKLLVRDPHQNDAVTMSFDNTPLFREHIYRDDGGTFESRGQTDDQMRINGYRVVPGLPLIVLVTQARTETLEEWYAYLRTQLPLRIFLMLIIFIGTIKLAQQSSRFSSQNELLQATLHTMHEGLIVVDGNDRIALCNPKALQLLDLPAQLMMSYPTAADVIAYQDSSGEFANVSDQERRKLRPKVLGEGESVYERRRPNGRILQIRTIPLTGGGVVRTYLDVTDHRRFEKELAQKERQFRMLAEYASDVIARVEVTARIRYVSPSCRRILGYAPEELLSAKILNFVHPDDLGATRAFFRDIIAAPDKFGGQRIQFRIKHKNGEWLWFESAPTPLLDNEGKVYEFVDVMRDISRRKRMEADAETAKTQIEQAARAKSEFLASMSHELRTPLNAILGFTGLLLDGPELTPEARRKVGHIQTASDGLLAIVNDVLDMARIEEGRLEIAPAPFTTAGFLESTVSMVKHAAEAKYLDFRMTVGPGIAPRLVADTQRLRQILLNFLNNAIKFTHEGFVELELTLLGEEQGGQMLQFAVSDSGIGIPAEMHDRVFQRFSQVDQSIGRTFGGSGLGLAISQRLVLLMGGDIGFESRPGSGSRFWVKLKLPIAATGDEAPPPASDSDGDEAPGGQLLLAEDVLVNREIAVAILKRRGFHVDTVSDGAEAIEAAKSKPYDLILMDVQMPKLDGISATRAIRALPAPAGTTPIVAMTANVLQAQVQEYLAAGINDHIGKPFKPAELQAVIVRNMRTKASQATAVEEKGDGTIEELRTIMGAAEVDRLLASLSQRLFTFLALSESANYNVLAEELHRLASSAGLLGYSQASLVFSQTEQSLRSAQEPEELVERARAVSRATLAGLRQTTCVDNTAPRQPD